MCLAETRGPTLDELVVMRLQVKLTVRIAPGARVRKVVVRELEALGATYAIFDRFVSLLFFMLTRV